jgi:hypothetical protein
MNGTQGSLLTAGSTDATVIVLTDVDYNEKKNFFVKVVSGTIKLGIGAEAAAANHGWTSSDVVLPFSCKNGELYFDAASALDTFVVTATP